MSSLSPIYLSVSLYDPSLSVSLSPSLSSDTMNSALSLCRRSVTAGPGLRLLAGSPGLPAGAVRVCHSGPNRRSSVSTKKRGYDITRNPQLNKVRHSYLLVVESSPEAAGAWSRCSQPAAIGRLGLS